MIRRVCSSWVSRIAYEFSFRATVVPQLQSDSGTLVVNYIPNTPAGALLIEAEDFNTDGGDYLPVANTMPYLGGAYTNLAAVEGIDYQRGRARSPTATSTGSARRTTSRWVRTRTPTRTIWFARSTRAARGRSRPIGRVAGLTPVVRPGRGTGRTTRATYRRAPTRCGRA